MKKLKFVTLMICCLAAVSLTSCNSEEDYTGLTPEQKAAAYNTVKGSYEGDLIYPSQNPSNKSDVADTLQVKWEINTDSTLVIRNFPMALLANNITNENLAKAIKAERARDLKCYISFTQVTPVNFFINPVTPSFSLNINGKNQLVQVAMLINNIYSFGVYDATKNSIQMQIVEAAIYVNGILQSGYLSSSMPFIFKATKK